MPKPVQKLRSMLNRLRDTLFKGVFRARFRYDVFISYNHRAKGYAVNLKKQLADLDFACFIDQEEAPPGSSLDPTLEKALSKSAVLVLLATERALTRPYIALEFQKFVSTGRRIIPINISGALTENDEEALARTPWDIIKTRKLIWIDEADEAFAKEIPSPPIADGIDKLFKYTRRNSRVRTEIIGTAVMVLLLAVGAGFVIKGKAAEVSKQAGLAEVAKNETVKQLGIAGEATKEANRQLGIARLAGDEAKRQGELADAATKEARRQQEIARAATAEADKQLKLAQTAKAEAERQQAIAAAQLERNRYYLYDSDVNLAQHAREAGDMARAYELLDAHLPNPAMPDQADLRGFDWYYLWPLTHRDLFTLEGHKARVTSVAFSPNGKTLATASTDDDAKLWSISSRREIAKLDGDPDLSQQMTSEVKIAFSHDGKTLAIVDAATGLKLWNPTSHSQPVWLQKGEQTGFIDKIAFSPDDRTLVTNGGETIYQCEITLWDVPSGKKQVIDEDGSAAMSPDGKLIAVRTRDNKVSVLDVASRKELAAYEAPSISHSYDSFLALSPNGELVALKEEGTLHLWDLKLGKRVASLGQSEIVGASFSPDGKTLASASPDGMAELWDVTSKTKLGLLYGHSKSVRSVAFSPDGKTLATASDDETIKLWDATPRTDSVKVGTGESLDHLSFSPDGKLVATGGAIWDVRTQAKVAEWKPDNSVTSLAFSSTGNNVSFVVGSDTANTFDVAAQQLLDTRKGVERSASTPPNPSVLVSPNGNVIAVITTEGSVQLWDVQSRHESGALKGVLKNDHLLAFSPDGKFLATADYEFTVVHLWDVVAQKEIETLKWNRAAAVFSPGSKILVATLDGETVKVWDITSRRELYTIKKDLAIDAGGFADITFSPDEKAMGIRSSNSTNKLFTVRIFDLASGKQLGILKEHLDFGPIAFSPNGKTIATGTNDGVKLWSAKTYQELFTTRFQTRGISALAFSPDGKILAAGDIDGTLRFLYAASDKDVADERRIEIKPDAAK
jgi:WD40 repeat protein